MAILMPYYNKNLGNTKIGNRIEPPFLPVQHDRGATFQSISGGNPLSIQRTLEQNEAWNPFVDFHASTLERGSQSTKLP